MNDPLAILSSRKELDSTRFGYLLEENRKLYGIDSVFPDDSEGWVDEKNMALWIPIADGNRRDGVGDLLEVQGIVTERHRKNPVVLFDHGKQVTLPIAMACERNGDGHYDRSKYTFQIDASERSARLNAYFYQGKGMSGVERGKEYDHALFTEQLFDMVAKRMLGAGSIGYQVIKSIPLQPDYSAGTPEGVHLIKILMLEGSLVVMPANMDTVQKCLAMPTICGKPISPYLVKSLTPHAGPKKVQMGYEAKANDKVLSAMKTAWAALSDEEKDGIGLWVNAPDASPRLCVIDVMDWGSEDVGKKLKSAAAKAIGDETRVVMQNEGGKPDSSWTAIKSLSKPVEKSIKELRQKYKAASDELRSPSARRQRAGIDDTFRPGDTVTARIQLNEPGNITAPPIAMPGDRLKVISVNPAALNMIVERNGRQRQVMASSVRKSLEGTQTKSLDLSNVRKKYRTGKNLRRRLKRSSPGASVICVGKKDVDAVEEMAKDKGLKAHQLGTADGETRIKLIGDDASADEVAKAFGRPIGVKSLNAQTKAIDQEKAKQAHLAINRIGYGLGRPKIVGDALVYNTPDPEDAEMIAADIPKILSRAGLTGTGRAQGRDLYVTLTKSLNGKIKSMDDTELGDVETNDLDTDTGSSEPWGAQVLRKFHADHSAMMKDYDELLGPLEHEGVKAHVTKHLQNIEKALGETEKMWAKHYKDLPGLEGVDEAEETTEDDDSGLVEEKDADTMDDNANPAASNEPDLPAPEEVLEGMEGKGDEELDQEMKSLRSKYRMKALGKSVCPKCDGEPCKCKGKKLQAKKKSTEVPVPLNNLPDSQVPPSDWKPGVGAKLLPHHKAQVGEAAGFLKEIGAPGSQFDDEERMKSFHYHKTLEGMQQVAGDETGTKRIKSVWGVECSSCGNNFNTRGSSPPTHCPACRHKLSSGDAELMEKKLKNGDEAGTKGVKGARFGMYQNPRGEWMIYNVATDQDVDGPYSTSGQAQNALGRWNREGHKSVPGSPEWAAEEANEPEHKGIKSVWGVECSSCGNNFNTRGSSPPTHCPACRHRLSSGDAEIMEKKLKSEEAIGEGDMFKTIGEASETFKRFSQEKAFGDPHREEANKMCKALEDLTNASDEEQKDDDEMNDLANEPGEMGQKGVEEDDELEKMLKKLKEDNEEQDKKMKELNRKLLSLNGTR